MARFDDETRRRLATGWDPRVCTAREYARQNGISERALRLWRARLPPSRSGLVPERHDPVPLHAALDALQERLDGLEVGLRAVRAGLAAARAALRSDSSTSSEVESRDAAPAVADECEERAHPVAQVQPAPRVVPVPVPRKSYFQDFA